MDTIKWHNLTFEEVDIQQNHKRNTSSLTGRLLFTKIWDRRVYIWNSVKAWWQNALIMYHMWCCPVIKAKSINNKPTGRQIRADLELYRLEQKQSTHGKRTASDEDTGVRSATILICFDERAPTRAADRRNYDPGTKARPQYCNSRVNRPA